MFYYLLGVAYVIPLIKKERNCNISAPGIKAVINHGRFQFDSLAQNCKTLSMPNSFGHVFRITTWGESHGGSIGVVIDGCPPNIPLSEKDIQPDLDRRKPGQSSLTTPRKEADRVQIYSGTFQGKTLGTPLCLMVMNQDAHSQDYDEMAEKFRPSHADFCYQAKYGIRNWQGGGRSSARETLARVAAGAVARKILHLLCGVEIVACVSQVHHIKADIHLETLTAQSVESNTIRCPDPQAAAAMIEHIEQIKQQGNSVGGIISCIARNVPTGWGEPVFDKLEADLAKAMLSIPAAKGFDIGSGFDSIQYTGIEHNDLYRNVEGKIVTTTNRSGGIQGGISNGMPITFRVAFKPTATILKEQATVDLQGNPTTIQGKGRHDPCVLPRAVPVVEAMCALTLLDHALRQRVNSDLFPLSPEEKKG